MSLILRPRGSGLEFLAIKRVESERDPWSGDMALPGGRRETGDESLWSTAVRETQEEVGLDLSAGGRLLGQLDAVQPVSRLIPAIAITPFVVALTQELVPTEGPEVERSIWVPVSALLEERYQGRLRLERVPERDFPSVEFGGYVIWGLTLSILGQLVEVLGRVGYREGEGS